MRKLLALALGLGLLSLPGIMTLPAKAQAVHTQYTTSHGGSALKRKKHATQVQTHGKTYGKRVAKGKKARRR